MQILPDEALVNAPRRRTRRRPGPSTRQGEPLPVGPARPTYVTAVAEAIAPEFAAATDLATFLTTTQSLSAEQRLAIVGQALILLEQNYAHLPLKRAMHSVDPVQRLKLLQRRLELWTGPLPPDVEFHHEMTDIFTSVRDLHTNYLLPEPFAGAVAFLPFMVEDYVEDGTSRYLVSHVMPSFAHPTFVPGVEIRYWNGMPIDRAVWAHAQRYAGSNRDARHARGVQTLTARALVVAPPPDEEWVIVGYRDATGDHELRFDWQVKPTPETAGTPENLVAASAVLGLDLEQETIQRTRRVLFKPQVVTAARIAAARWRRRATFGGLSSSLPHAFEAKAIATGSGRVGYLRIRTFNHWPPDEFVDEFVRLLGKMPARGLIIDVRGNGGGVIMNGERLLQTLTPRPITPEPVQFLNTPLNLRICERHAAGSTWADLSTWVDSMRESLQTGAAFSAGFPITSPDECNAIGQKYFGPVVLVTDALCYSTTDIFAAGFQDHEVGPVLGVDARTGAGGANVWHQADLAELVLPGEDSVYRPLPNGAAMRVSMRRTLRVGRRAGTPVEDFGVAADHMHQMTRNDLLHGNVDLLEAAAALLVGRPRVRFTARVTRAGNVATLQIRTSALTRLDVYVDGRPTHTLDVTSPTTTVAVRAGPGAALVVQGFSQDTLRARWLGRA